ncbi:response regulator transcription factor [Deinococcus ruber]|uniref:DNA-binding response regulator n=1 Tax=Deinococcus ruber TaxID=1848197 RepID=A0A918CGQ7_9DEIO|nr:response regulator transcription factor [Deinococcus ruber]GGR23280.1 hypothetical protein GCM10008957_39030 [Deinococcus ruber]
MHVLIVGDDPDPVHPMKLDLKNADYQVSSAQSVMRGLMTFRKTHPDLILLDLELPDGDGRQLLRWIRQHSSVPVIVLTACDTVVDKVELLNLGADDYLTKPCHIQELLARIAVHFRAAQVETLRFRELTVQQDRRLALIRTREVALSPREFDYLVHLMRRPEQIYSRLELRNVGQGQNTDNESVVDVHVANLRSKLGAAGAYGMIRTVRGVGYTLRT